MLLLELDDDEHDLSYAFFVWLAVVGALWYASRQVQRRDAQRIDAAAAGNVDLVRQRLQRQRSGEGAAAAAVAGPPGGPAAAAAAGAGAGAGPRAPREREDCPICLSTTAWPVDTNCAHVYCAECFFTYHEQAGGLMPAMVKCPCCRRAVDVILPLEPGWTNDEVHSDQGRELREKLDQYNARYSSEERSWTNVLRDTPHYLARFWRELTSGGDASSRLVRQMRVWLIIVLLTIYMLSPWNLMPESLFGVIGLLDDLLVVIVGLVMIAGVFRSIALQQH